MAKEGKERFGQTEYTSENELFNLRRKIKELKKQIEKMKCCRNCRKSRVGNSCPYWNNSFQCKEDNYKEWELLTD